VRVAYLRRHPLERLTDATICDAKELEKELERIRKRGYAFDREEYALGVSCIAAPLLQDGQIVAAVGISLPTDRFKRKRQALAETLLEVIAQASRVTIGDAFAAA
jgi:DNA-binding IclR family transcriptional regulator